MMMMCNASATIEMYTLSLHDALPIFYSTWLKIGTTSLVLQALLNGAPPDRVPRVSDPIQTLKTISRDRTWKWLCRDAQGYKRSEEHTSELQSQSKLVCRLLLAKKKNA